MALIGGGGVGNVSGGNPSGTGGSLNYIGEHVYGYSGIISITNVEQSLMEFTTSGSAYIVAKVQFSYANAAGDDYLYKIYLDNQIIQSYVNAAGTTQYGDDVLNILIPPESKVKFTAANITDSSDQQQCVSIVGRIYA